MSETTEGLPQASTDQMDPPIFLSRQDLSHHLRLGLSTIDRLITTGKLPKADVIIGARVRLWARTTIQGWRFIDGVSGQ